MLNIFFHDMVPKTLKLNITPVVQHFRNTGVESQRAKQRVRVRYIFTLKVYCCNKTKQKNKFN